jgi:hypothetical protein
MKESRERMKKGTIWFVLFIACMMISGCSKKDEHVWNEATCTVPKTCSECGATEGEALGHDTEIGKCDRCGEWQNEDVVSEIIQYYQQANTYIT